MIFDFAGHRERSSATKVLLVGMQRHRLEKIQKLFDAAGHVHLAVTSSGLAIAFAATASTGVPTTPPMAAC